MYALQRPIKGACKEYTNNLFKKKVYQDNPASILYKSIAGRYRPFSYPDGPITARYRFIKNVYWEASYQFDILHTFRKIYRSIRVDRNYKKQNKNKTTKNNNKKITTTTKNNNKKTTTNKQEF